MVVLPFAVLAHRFHFARMSTGHLHALAKPPAELPLRVVKSIQ